jgi:hypothetical protein
MLRVRTSNVERGAAYRTIERLPHIDVGKPNADLGGPLFEIRMDPKVIL